MALVRFADDGNGVFVNPARVCWLSSGVYDDNHVKPGKQYTRVWFSGDFEDYLIVEENMTDVAARLTATT